MAREWHLPRLSWTPSACVRRRGFRHRSQPLPAAAVACYYRNNLLYSISEEMTKAPGPAERSTAVSEAAVITKAVLRAANRLGVSNKALAATIGLSEASVSRMGSGAYTLTSGDKAFDLAVLFVRLFRALDAIVHGDDAVAQAWLGTRTRCLAARLWRSFSRFPDLSTQSVPGRPARSRLSGAASRVPAGERSKRNTGCRQ